MFLIIIFQYYLFIVIFVFCYPTFLLWIDFIALIKGISFLIDLLILKKYLIFPVRTYKYLKIYHHNYLCFVIYSTQNSQCWASQSFHNQPHMLGYLFEMCILLLFAWKRFEEFFLELNVKGKSVYLNIIYLFLATDKKLFLTSYYF